MRLYAESSAILAWLLREPDVHEIERALSAASDIVSSDLTLIECDRAIARALALKRVSETEAAECHAELEQKIATWNVLHLGAEVVARARRPYPAEPIRALDAIHLACVLTVRTALPELALLSLDERVRAAARGLAIPLLPAYPASL